MSVDEGGWIWQMSVLRKQFPGLALNSGFRNNSVVAGSGGLSYHSRGRAVDVPPRADVFNWIAANYPQSAELIFTPAGSRQILNGKSHVYSGQTAKDHYSHVHWAIVDQTNPTGGSAVIPAGLPNPIDAATDAINNVQAWITNVTDTIKFLTDPAVWMRVGVALGGLILLVIGLARMSGNGINVPKVVTNVSRLGSK